jgi:hypothetical protein
VVWDFYPHKQDVFIGEVLLDLAIADLQESSLWYPLEKHDENCGNLPIPSPKGSELGARERGQGEESQGQWSSLPMIPATPAHDKMKQLLGKRGSELLELLSPTLDFLFLSCRSALVHEDGPRQWQSRGGRFFR